MHAKTELYQLLLQVNYATGFVMKKFLLMFVLTFFSHAFANDFETEAKLLALDLKTSLMENLAKQISKGGPARAVSFCHANVKSIAKTAAAKRIKKYEFGRTSHKIRNQDNQPKAWAESYLKEFQGTFKAHQKKDFLIHQLENSKKIYLEPLYVEAKCLLCHGENISPDVQKKLRELYPNDQATGFKLGEFRGFIWVKQKS